VCAIAARGAGLRGRAVGETDRVAEPERWYDPEEVRPSDLATLSRCPDCQTGPMFHRSRGLMPAE
jgi:hypothetical protein